MAPGIEKREIIIDCVEVQVQPTSSKTDTFGAGNMCLYWRGVSLIESQTNAVKKFRDQLSVSILVRCPSYRGVR